MRLRNYLAFIALGALGLASCADDAAPPESRDDAFRVAVSIAPLRSLVEPMLPADSVLDIVLSEQSSPHADELRPSSAQAAYRADLLVYIGGGADPSVERIARRRAASGRPSVAIASDHAMHSSSTSHDHGHDHALMHAWLDPHTIEHAIPEVRNAIRTALQSSGMSQADMSARIDAASETALRNVREVDRAFRIMLGAMPPTRFVSYHGAFDGLLEEYGLEHVTTLLSGHGAEPTAERLTIAASELRRADTILIVEATENLDAIHRLIESTGARVARLDALHPDDWESMMRANLRAIVAARTGAP